jgi:hypothetical protein
MAAAKKQVKVEFFIHLATCADDAQYQSWAKKLGLTAIPASEKAAKSEPVAAAAEATPVAAPAPAPAPVAVVKEEEPKAKAPAKKAPAKKADDIKVYTKGVPENGNALKAEVSKHWGEGWAKDAEKKAKLQEIANALVEGEIPVFRNGEVAEEFSAFIAEQCAEDDI